MMLDHPAAPFDWRLRYADGHLRPRTAGPARTATRAGLVALEVTGPGLDAGLTVWADRGTPDEVVIRRQWALAYPGARRLLQGWRFGFQYGGTFRGVVVDPAGTVRRTR